MSTNPSLRARLARWTYPYALAAAVTFLVGALVGAAAVAVTPQTTLAELADSFRNTNPFPDRLTTWTIFRNNVVVLGIVAVGAVTFAATTLVALLFNGFLLGVVAAAGGDRPLVVLALVVPHGVFELGAFFLVGGVAYRTSWRLVSYLRGVAETPTTREEVVDAVALVVVGVLLTALAAWVEATLTDRLARLLVGNLP